MMYKNYGLVLLSLLIFTGCSHDIYIASNKEPSYTKKLDRIVIEDNLNKTLSIFLKRLEPVVIALSTGLRKRGVAVRTIVPRMEVQSEKGKDLKEAIATFMPTQVMELNPVGYETGHQYERYVLQVSISDVAQQRVVWKSSVDFWNYHPEFGMNVEKFVNELIMKLEADGLLKPASSAANKPAQKIHNE